MDRGAKKRIYGMYYRDEMKTNTKQLKPVTTEQRDLCVQDFRAKLCTRLSCKNMCVKDLRAKICTRFSLNIMRFLCKNVCKTLVELFTDFRFTLCFLRFSCEIRNVCAILCYQEIPANLQQTISFIHPSTI